MPAPLVADAPQGLQRVLDELWDRQRAAAAATLASTDLTDSAQLARLGGVGIASQGLAGTASGSITLPRASTVVITYAGSGWRPGGTGSGVSYMEALLNGAVAQAIGHYFNLNDCHLAMGPGAVVANLAAGTHSVQLRAGSGLARDANDWNLISWAALG